MKTFKRFAFPLALALPLLALAQVAPPLPVSPIQSITDITGTGGGTGILCIVFRWIFFILILVAAIYILLATFKYITSGGDPEKVKVANKEILFAAIAVVIAFVARNIPNIMLSIIGSSGITGGTGSC